MQPRLDSLDHLVLTVSDPDTTVAFYTSVLGMEAETFVPQGGSPRLALRFGGQKINIHPAAAPFAPHAAAPTCGAGDLCFLTAVDLGVWQAHLAALGVRVEEGPVRRTGARGPILSLYIRDPDANLIEIAVPFEPGKRADGQP